ncbi:MAG: excinuclease ABC subunit B [Desulfobacterales bacterium CG07_land_8_20_14_0_80_52_14]|nr:MAG: excinuclease ABC subunit B [Desulfobacterales bacterium CG23_combo_of_CG06-09_8_20_14_all_52_9]PIU49119.1 MAG: excinuclease ABC subunit B [Desulfobacterales bacterium CG07_land_8_20_14_0_80_52_14]
MPEFKLTSNFTPKGDQPKAMASLCRSIVSGKRHQVLLGVTGSGKTFTMANVIATIQRPTLVIAPNKTLAAQLYQEFRGFFPENAVEYFVSYYDYYQPEAYIPSTDTYIQKDSSINEMIDKLRHSATRSVLTRRDVIVVASVSCIFGLGAPEDYLAMRVDLINGASLSRDKLLSDLATMHYSRNDYDFHRGVFRVRGDRVEIFPAYEEDRAVRVEFFGDQIEGIAEIDPLRGVTKKRLERMTLFPASHYVTEKNRALRAIEAIKTELKERIEVFRREEKLIEAQRIDERTLYDLEMIAELGYCTGIENYSRHFTGRGAGEPPPTLLDYFPKDFLLFIDESHIAVPQLRGMYLGDRSRKETLVAFGFRLPSALDNRPLTFEEFNTRVPQVIFVSATPADYELLQAGDAVAEQIVRPTGLADPELEVRSARNQVDDLFQEILLRKSQDTRILVTTLTKRMAEDLTEYLSDLGIRVRYLHSDISTLDRMEIIRELRIGKFDVLVGINLLREGLDIPEVSLVVILDADKEGFLRSRRSLIQTFGRASRNVKGKVILYADEMTQSMKEAIDETARRRTIQIEYNRVHHITPETVEKEITRIFESVYEADYVTVNPVREPVADYAKTEDLESHIASLENEMKRAAAELAFERAAQLRDRIRDLKKRMVFEW